MTALAELSTVVLGPLAGRPEASWQQAPPGKWTPAQIVEHLALAMESSAAPFAARRGKGPMARRPTTLREKLAKLLVLGLGRFPPGRKAPQGTAPAPRVERSAAEARFRAALAAWDVLERELLPARRSDLFVKHRRFGDLTLEEWMRFHVVHARHHARQIRDRLGG
jgi:hypothetical protein